MIEKSQKIIHKFNQNKYKYPIVTWGSAPTETDNVHTNNSKPIVSIIEPNTSVLYSPDEKIQLKINNSGRFTLQKIDIFINDVFLSSISAPFNFSFIPSELENLRENNDIKIISYDTAYNHAETTSTFRISQ